METQIDPQSLAAGNYEFLIAQDDAKVHEVPFKVLPAPPQISNLPLVAHSGGNSERVTLRGTGLDRIEDLSADDAQITLGEAKKGDEREADVMVNPGIAKGSRITVQMKVKDFEQPIGLTDALLVAGPRPAITGVRASLPSDLGVELQAGEIPGNSFMSFALDVGNAPVVTGVRPCLRRRRPVRTGQIASGAEWALVPVFRSGDGGSGRLHRHGVACDGEFGRLAAGEARRHCSPAEDRIVPAYGRQGGGQCILRCVERAGSGRNREGRMGCEHGNAG